MIRSEAALLLHKWRELLFGVTLCALGLVLFQSYGLRLVLGALLICLGLLLCLTGWRSARFAADITAPGHVQINEGQVLYLGPLLGGAVDISELVKVTYQRAKTGDAFWRLTPAQGETLIIPAGASGVELLIDALVVLPKFEPAKMVQAAQSKTSGQKDIWQKPLSQSAS